VPYQADFLENAEPRWDEVPNGKPRPTTNQLAMFMDRPDLWPSRPKRRRNGCRPLEGQPPLFREEES